MQSSVLCGVRVNMMERRPLVAIGRKATDRIRDIYYIIKGYMMEITKQHNGTSNEMR